MFAGLTSGSSALSYYMTGIETAGHNIANANVEGFARQRVNTSTLSGNTESYGTVGNGIAVDSITRIRSLFLDAQYRAQLPTLGYWEKRASDVTNLELYTGNINNGTFQTALTTYWTGLEDLHIYPDQETSRQISVSNTNSMISSLLEMRSNVDTYRSDLNEQVADMVAEANELIDTIAVLCDQIAEAQAKGDSHAASSSSHNSLGQGTAQSSGVSFIGSKSQGPVRLTIPFIRGVPKRMRTSMYAQPSSRSFVST
jgi:flagellar hook-associated protein 1 FlgK